MGSEVGGRSKSEGMYVYILYIADTLCGTAETNKPLQSNYTPTKKIFLIKKQFKKNNAIVTSRKYIYFTSYLDKVVKK